jgi:hypothetical protein
MIRGSVGWTANAEIRPPTLRGPLDTQLCRAPESSAATSAARRGSREPAAVAAMIGGGSIRSNVEGAEPTPPAVSGAPSLRGCAAGIAGSVPAPLSHARFLSSCESKGRRPGLSS